MIKRLTKFALVAALGLALTFTFSCSGGGDDGDEQSCGVELDGVWEAYGAKITISGSIGVYSALPSGHGSPWKVGDQIYRGLKINGDLTWSGQERILDEYEGVIIGEHWSNVQLTMSADGQKLTAISFDPVFYGDTETLTRKSCGGSSSPSSSSSLGGSSSSEGGDWLTCEEFDDLFDECWYKYESEYDACRTDACEDAVDEKYEKCIVSGACNGVNENMCMVHYRQAGCL